MRTVSGIEAGIEAAVVTNSGLHTAEADITHVW